MSDDHYEWARQHIVKTSSTIYVRRKVLELLDKHNCVVCGLPAIAFIGWPVCNAHSYWTKEQFGAFFVEDLTEQFRHSLEEALA